MLFTYSLTRYVFNRIKTLCIILTEDAKVRRTNYSLYPHAAVIILLSTTNRE